MAYGIFAYNDNAYICGYDTDITAVQHACYWINQEKDYLNNDAGVISMGYSIFVTSDND